MSALAIKAEDRRHWSVAATVALLVHIGVAALVLLWVRPAEPPLPEPVVLIELPPPVTAGSDAPTAPMPAQPRMDVAPQPTLSPPVDMPPMAIPPVRAPLPSNPVVVPPASSSPTSVAQATPAAVPAARPDTAPAVNAATSATPGNDPRARQQEANYFALISAHLNRRKQYPTEARQARQQGVVTVRFTVDRNGAVSGVSIKRSSGHDILDRATLDLVQRVSPLPRMPSSITRDSITLSLPIDYSLRTS